VLSFLRCSGRNAVGFPEQFNCILKALQLNCKSFSVEKLFEQNCPFCNMLILSQIKNSSFLPIFALKRAKMRINRFYTFCAAES